MNFRSLFSQDLNKKDSIASILLEKNYLQEANELYRSLYKKTNKPKYAYRLGICESKQRNFEEAIKYFNLALVDPLFNNKHTDSLLLEAMMSVADYTGVKEILKTKYSYEHQQFNYKFIYADSIEFWEKEKNGTAYPLNTVNTIYSELCPFIMKDKIYFSSNRIGANLEKQHPVTQENFFDIYYATIDSSVKNKSARPFITKINSPLNEIAIVFDTLSSLYFTREVLDPDTSYRTKIFRSENKNGHWGEPFQFFLNDSLNTFMHPYISPDGKVFVFSADLNGQKNGMDIFISFKKGDAWTKPKSLESINTSGNEICPFIDSEGNIYFSSNKHPGIGGYDIFISKFNGDGWDTPLNLKLPVNSPGDDLSYFMDEKSNRIFLSSNRTGSVGKEDIFILK